eukprot:TRINITY_DN6265_c0_g2_i1.p1 TRINITY_DN6265_c0_g2~~TRINITY_DN6265_c0_g2_i1.p1  ORF type:complete len:270 (+),score=15.65 TRINITY_DN6265_c0_g2_i1:73-810(+)
MPSEPITGCRRGVRITFSRPSPWRRSGGFAAAGILLCSFFTQVEGVAVSRVRKGDRQTSPACKFVWYSKGCAWTKFFSCPGQKMGILGMAIADRSSAYACCCKEQMWRHQPTPCQTYLKTTGCEWTGLYSCPDQVKGERGEAQPDDSVEYDCCCTKRMWTKAKFFPVRQVPARFLYGKPPTELDARTGRFNILKTSRPLEVSRKNTRARRTNWTNWHRNSAASARKSVVLESSRKPSSRSAPEGL